MFEEDLNYQEFKTISDITDAFTFEATGINVDYLLTLQRNNTGFLKKQVTIHTYFADIFNELKNYYQDEDKLELKEFNKEYLNSCNRYFVFRGVVYSKKIKYWD